MDTFFFQLIKILDNTFIGTSLAAFVAIYAYSLKKKIDSAHVKKDKINKFNSEFIYYASRIIGVMEYAKSELEKKECIHHFVKTPKSVEKDIKMLALKTDEIPMYFELDETNKKEENLLSSYNEFMRHLPTIKEELKLKDIYKKLRGMNKAYEKMLKIRQTF